MGLLDGLRRRKWKARLDRHPRVEADHAAGLERGMRDAVAALLGRLPAPATGRWFAGGYRLPDLLDRREVLGTAKWYVSSPDAAMVARLTEALPDSIGLPGGFVEKLAGFPVRTFDGILILWSAAPPLNLLLRVASTRLIRGGRVGVLALKDGTPEPTGPVMRRAVRQATGATVKCRGVGNPESPAELRSWFHHAACGEAVCWLDGRNLVFENGTEARLCLESISGEAAFPEKLSGQELARARAAFDAMLEEECRGAGNARGGAVLGYEFVGGLAVKGE
ncbi:MAG: hypothetical protein AAB434_07375 [Planctomycetota bacterium]